MRPGFAAAIAVLACALAASARAGGAQSCARPNVSATVVRAVTAETPVAAGQIVQATVQVLVNLDPSSRVTGTMIRSSPSAVLNAPALAAARQSTYQTEIRDCVPIASDFVFNVQFSSASPSGAAVAPPIAPPVATPSPRVYFPEPVVQSGGDRRPTVVIAAQGVALRPPDVAYVNVGIVTNDDVAATATSQNAALFDALRTNLKPLGIDDTAIRTAFFNVAFLPHPTPPPSPQPAFIGRYGYVATRQLTVTVTDLRTVGAVIDAAAAAGVTGIGILQFALIDRDAAHREALAAALKDAADQARAVAAASRMHLGPLKQIQVGQNAGPPPPAPVSGARPSSPTGAGAPATLHPPLVEVRATATVTYFLKP